VLDADNFLNPTDAPGLAALPALRHLQLQRMRELDAAVLASSAASLTGLQISHRWDGMGTLRDLLQLLSQMQQLQQLELGWPYKEAYFDGQLSADNCSLPGKITCLRLGSMALTPAAVAYMLSGSRKAPTLRAFGLDYSNELMDRQYYVAPLDPDNLGSLVRTWPQLQELDLIGAVAAPAAAAAMMQEDPESSDLSDVPTDDGPSDLSEGEGHAASEEEPATVSGWFALAQLTALTSLALGGRQQGDALVKRELLPMAAALPRLQSLQLLHCPKLSGLGILQLTQLTQLTSLKVDQFNDDDWYHKPHMGIDWIELTSKVSWGCCIIRCPAMREH
jgi:hypothetical protein